MNILIRVPNWLGDVIMAWPVIQGIKNKYPQANISLIGLSGFASLVKVLDETLTFYPLPQKSLSYYWKVMRTHRAKYDVHVLFTNSERGDMEAWLINAPRRIGVQQGKKARKLLNEPYQLSSKISQSGTHQTKVWENMAQASNLLDVADNEGVRKIENTQNSICVGLICGSENSPEKRWSPKRWRALIETLLEQHKADKILLFGTQGDAEICTQIAKGFNTNQVVNRAGKTNLEDFAKELLTCKTVIANDTGGLHLANALGVPVIGLYGPTNPVSSGPVFNGATIIQPQNCPPTGGLSIDLIEPEEVIALI